VLNVAADDGLLPFAAGGMTLEHMMDALFGTGVDEFRFGTASTRALRAGVHAKTLERLQLLAAQALSNP